jgi:hypothetical protein
MYKKQPDVERSGREGAGSPVKGIGRIDHNLLLPGRQMRQRTHHVVPGHRQDNDLTRRGFCRGHRRHPSAQGVHRVA